VKVVVFAPDVITTAVKLTRFNALKITHLRKFTKSYEAKVLVFHTAAVI